MTDVTPHETESTPLSRGHWWAIALIVAAGSIVYANSFRGVFVFDDAGSIIENKSVHQLWPIWKVLAGDKYTTVAGRPLLNLSLAVNYALASKDSSSPPAPDVWGFHLYNLVVHLLAALTLFGVLRRTLLLPGTRPGLARHATGLALTIALIWTVHPLQTESVTYIVQRAESMVALFYLLTFYCVIRGAQSEARATRWYAGSVVACLGGMATKEVMVSAPVMLVLYDSIFLTGSLQETIRRRWPVYTALFLTWIPLGIFLVSSRGREGSAGFDSGMPVWVYARTQFSFLMRYLKLSFWPSPLIFDYGFSTANKASEIVPYAMGVGLLALATVVALFRWPRLGYVGLCFFAIISPSSSIVPINSQTGAEHRMYLPLAAVVTLTVIVAFSGWQKITAHAGDAAKQPVRVLRWIPLLLVAAIVSAFGYLTIDRNRIYRSVDELWAETVRLRPQNARARLQRGCDLYIQQDVAGALAQFDAALALKPDYAMVLVRRGAILETQNKLDEALRDYTLCNKIDARITAANLGCARIHQIRDQYEEALRDYDRAIVMSPSVASIHRARGVVCRRLGKLEDAIQSLTACIRLQPLKNPLPYNERGLVYEELGAYDRALSDYNKAIEQDPEFAMAYNNRGTLFGRSGQLERAIEDFSAAIRLVPTYGPVYKNRALCYFDTQNYQAAWKDVETAQKLGVTFDPKLVGEIREKAKAAR